MSPLLENSIKSIRLGVQDYQSDDPDRVLSAARNVYAGVLLLCKEVLRQLSPEDELLIMQDIVPVRKEGVVKFVGKEKGKSRKTVDKQQIIERFESLGLSLDEKKIQNIARIRNDIEHYYSTHSRKQINEAFSDAFIVIRNLATNHLEQNVEDLLGRETWKVLDAIRGSYEEERDYCQATLKNIDWETGTLEAASEELRCPDCGSALILQQDLKNTDWRSADFRCRDCDAGFDPEELVKKAVMDSLEGEAYIAFKDAGELVYDDCPDCGEGIYVYAEEQCLMCGFSPSGKCAICSQPLSLEDYTASMFSDGPTTLCSYHAWQAGRDD